MDKVFNLPDNDKTGFISLIELSNEKLKKLFKSIDDLSDNASLKEVTKKISETDEGEILIKLISTSASWDEIEVDEFLKLIYDAYKTIKGEKATITFKVFKNKFESVFQKNNKLRIKLKTRSLRSQFSRIFYDSRIITDIRPVFIDHKTEELTGTVIIHTMKISYEDVENDGRKEFFINLDKEDLIELKDNITRALRKEEIIESKLDKELKTLKF